MKRVSNILTIKDGYLYNPTSLLIKITEVSHVISGTPTDSYVN